MTTGEGPPNDPEISLTQQTLDCPMAVPPFEETAPLGAATVRDFLVAMLGKLWVEGRDFDSHRPYGASDWDLDVYRSLGVAGLIDIKFGEEGDIDEVDSTRGAELISQAIASLGITEK